MLAALIENVQREDLNVIEQATAAKSIVKELKLTIQETAESLGMSRSNLSNLIHLLDLDPFILQLLAEDKISAGHARALKTLTKQKQIIAGRKITAEDLNVRQTEALVKKLANANKLPATKVNKIDPDIQRIAEELSTILQMKVNIQHGRNKNHGKFVIKYHSVDSFGLIDKLLRNAKKK